RAARSFHCKLDTRKAAVLRRIETIGVLPDADDDRCVRVRHAADCTNRLPGGGGVSGGPAKHCASDIHSCATSPLTRSAVSSMLRVCATTWQNSTAEPSTRLRSPGSFQAHHSPEGLCRRTYGFTAGTARP